MIVVNEAFGALFEGYDGAIGPVVLVIAILKCLPVESKVCENSCPDTAPKVP